jgi:hypothetical protein
MIDRLALPFACHLSMACDGLLLFGLGVHAELEKGLLLLTDLYCPMFGHDFLLFGFGELRN